MKLEKEFGYTLFDLSELPSINQSRRVRLERRAGNVEWQPSQRNFVQIHGFKTELMGIIINPQEDEETKRRKDQKTWKWIRVKMINRGI